MTKKILNPYKGLNQEQIARAKKQQRVLEIAFAIEKFVDGTITENIDIISIVKQDKFYNKLLAKLMLKKFA